MAIRTGSTVKDLNLKTVERGSIKATSILPTKDKKDNIYKKALAIDYQEPFLHLYQYCECCKNESRHRRYSDRVICIQCRMLTQVSNGN